MASAILEEAFPLHSYARGHASANMVLGVTGAGIKHQGRLFFFAALFIPIQIYADLIHYILH